MNYLLPAIIGGIGFFLFSIGDNTSAFLVYKILGGIALAIAAFWLLYVVGYNIGYSLS